MFIFFIYAYIEIRVACYTLPNLNKFIVRNSPIDLLASTITVAKTIKSPLTVMCVGCVFGSLVVDDIHKRMYPNSKSIFEHGGDYITKKTGYKPIPKDK